MSKVLKFIVHFVVICTILCVVALAAPPFFGVTTVIMDDTSKETNLPIGSVTYAIPVKTEDVKIGDPILVQENSKAYRYNISNMDLGSKMFTVVDPTVSEPKNITVAVKNYVPKVVITIGLLGYLLVATESIEGLIVLGLAVRKKSTKKEKRIMSVISMKQLLEAGVHFGHQTRRWNPKMARYIYTERNGIYIIDLQQSVGMVDDAYNAIADIVANGGSILFVGTKKQAQDAIKTEAERCGMYYVNERWLGGMLTNFKTIQSRIARLKQIEAMEADGTFDVLPKKEVIELRKEMSKLQKNLGGIKEMKRIPDAIFIVDPKKERICVQEAHTLGIPLIGICDTNCDPEELDYVIPGNDDAIRAVKLIVSKMADAVIEAKQGTTEADGEIEAESEEFAQETAE